MSCTAKQNRMCDTNMCYIPGADAGFTKGGHRYIVVNMIIVCRAHTNSGGSGGIPSQKIKSSEIESEGTFNACM